MENSALLQKRKPIWIALSNFYLDTDLDTEELKQIIQVFKASPYSIDEIKLIDRFEVRPVVGGNLSSIAGEWSHFDEEWLISWASELHNKNKKGNLISNLFYKIFLVSPYWRKVEKILSKSI